MKIKILGKILWLTFITLRNNLNGVFFVRSLDNENLYEERVLLLYS
jgi:hypothetical protein